jgi:glycosyltransferase involved in cell wall biosynthesis
MPAGECYGSEGDSTRPTIDPPDASVPGWCVERLGVSGALQAVGGWKPDVVYAHGSRSPDLEDALLARYPAVLFAHDHYGTCGTGSKCHSFPQPCPCSRTFGPMCLLLHYPRRCGGLNPLTMWSSYSLQARRNTLILRYDAVLVASAYMREEMLRHKVAAERLHLVPLSPTDVIPDAVAPSARPLTGEILLVGRLTDVKGGHYLLRALPLAAEALGRNLTLTVLGSGPARIRLERLASRYGVPVEFLGWVDSKRRTELMRTADLLAAPSLWPEPFGLVGIEAGCVGLPAVGYAVGGIPDWLVPGKSGELGPGDPPTVHGLAEAIIRALRDPERHASLRHGAWEIAKRFTMGAHLRALEQVLSQVATSRQ